MSWRRRPRPGGGGPASLNIKPTPLTLASAPLLIPRRRVIAHECGHGAFSKSEALNDAVGLVVHSLLLVPYFSWKFSHKCGLLLFSYGG